MDNIRDLIVSLRATYPDFQTVTDFDIRANLLLMINSGIVIHDATGLTLAHESSPTLWDFIPAIRDAKRLASAEAHHAKMVGEDQVSVRWESVAFKLSSLLLLIEQGKLTEPDRK